MALTQVPASMCDPDVATQAELDVVAAAAAATASAAALKLSGDLIQTVHSQTGSVSSSVTVMPLDDTIPQITEGTEILTATITPTNAANTLIIEAVVYAANNSGITNVAAIFQDSTANALAAGAIAAASNAIFPLVIRFKMTAGTTSATTFRLRTGPSTAVTMTVNGVSGGRLLGGVLISSLTVREMKA